MTETKHKIAFSTSRYRIVISVLAISLPLCMLGSLIVGAVHISIADIVSAAFSKTSVDPTLHTILFGLRLPHIMATAFVGSALAVAGLLFQGLFRNSLADPYVIGSSSGSLLGAAVAIFWFPNATFLGFGPTALFAFAGAAVTIGVVYLVAQSGTTGSSSTLLLAGFAIGTMLNGATLLIQTLSSSNLALRALSAWLQGTIETPTWQQLAVVAVMLACGLFCAWLLTQRLNTLALGDEYASQLGVPLEQTRAAVIVIGALLTAAAVSLGGLIAFVGLIVPHIVRMLIGPDNRRLLPACALGGATLVILADTLARTVVAPSELPIGILMAFLGGPFFLLLLRRRNEAYIT